MRIIPKQYAQVLYDLTDGKSKSEIEKDVSDFARYLQKERKLKLAEKIFEQFGKIYNEEKGIIEAEVVTAEKMGEALEKKVKGYVEKKYNAKEVALKNVIDPNIKGGIILKVGDEVMDGSAAGKLGELRKVLVT
jgi:F-type H+-transporting ATPase subunit delta